MKLTGTKVAVTRLYKAPNPQQRGYGIFLRGRCHSRLLEMGLRHWSW